MGILSLELTKEIFLFLNFSGEKGEIYLATVYAAFIHSLINRVKYESKLTQWESLVICSKNPSSFLYCFTFILGCLFLCYAFGLLVPPRGIFRHCMPQDRPKDTELTSTINFEYSEV